MKMNASAADWPKTPLWTGKLKIISRGRDAFVILWEEKNGEIAVFAKCPVTEGSVEKVTDSGRYFVLKIVNAQGQHAFIGIAFNERNDAFDFNVALQEHKNELEREDQAAQGLEDPTGPSQDFSLKSGEKITVKIGNKTGTRRDKASTGGGLLAPPGAKPTGLAPPVEAHSTPAVTANSTVFSFDSFATADPFGSTGAAPAAPSSTDPFFGGSGDPFAASSDPFGAPAATSTTGGTQLDAFGFPVAFSSPTTAETSSSSTSTNSGSVNLLDF